MANYLGLTIETVSRQMTALKKEGLIAFDETAAPGAEILVAGVPAGRVPD